jgi:hypothetical protein
MELVITLVGFVLWSGLWLWIYNWSGDLAVHFDVAWTNVGIRTQFLLKHSPSADFQSEWWIGYGVCMLVSYLVIAVLVLIAGASG